MALISAGRVLYQPVASPRHIYSWNGSPMIAGIPVNERSGNNKYSPHPLPQRCAHPRSGSEIGNTPGIRRVGCIEICQPVKRPAPVIEIKGNKNGTTKSKPMTSTASAALFLDRHHRHTSRPGKPCATIANELMPSMIHAGR